MSYLSVLDVSNGWPSNPKVTFKINSLRIKRKAQNSATWMLSEYAFKIGRKKVWFFGHSTTLNFCQQREVITFEIGLTGQYQISVLRSDMRSEIWEVAIQPRCLVHNPSSVKTSVLNSVQQKNASIADNLSFIFI